VWGAVLAKRLAHAGQCDAVLLLLNASRFFFKAVSVAMELGV